MNAPTTRDPLTVTTNDGTAWTRRAVTRGGRGLYAPEGVTGCPQFVMATLEELAEHGLQGHGEAGAPSECERLRARVDEVERAYTFDTAALKQRVAELEQHAAESRMSAIDDVANWLRSVGEDDAAYLVGTSDIPVAAVPERLEDAAPTQVIPVVDDVPVPVLLTDQDGPAVVTSAAMAAAAKLRRSLPLSGGERS
ncbi:hypothetical protein [Streptomyces sp. Inha503]|uniref:hypothetical protein n=1 Tax=Streptomyces sp. Inha503 TaxID=3383314 RepID=UPI0039A1F5E5